MSQPLIFMFDGCLGLFSSAIAAMFGSNPKPLEAI